MNNVEQLRARYLEPHRHYHTQEHIDFLLAGLNDHAALARDIGVIEAAIWYHDAIYETRRNDNEERSALLARDELQQAGWSDDKVARVQVLVCATARHQAPADDTDAWLFLDLDLSILGQSQSVYARYQDAIRLEYAWVDESAYRQGRRRVLETFLGRPKIYRTPVLRAALEQRARENLLHEINALGTV